MLTINSIILLLLNISIISSRSISCMEAISYFSNYTCVRLENNFGNEINSFKIEKNNSFFLLKVILSNGPEIKDNKNIFYLNKFGKEDFVVDLIEFKIFKEYTFIITKYFEFGNLLSTLNGTNYFEDQNNILNFFNKLLFGVKVFHDKEIFINNLKPNTLLVDNSFNPKIFNLSKSTQKLNNNKINDFHFLEDTLIDGYNSHLFTKKTDIYDLGLILYLLINKVPLIIEKDDKNPNFPNYNKNILSSKNENLKKHNKKKEKSYILKKGTLFLIAKIIETCLQNDKEKRHDVDYLINLIKKYDLDNTYILKEDTKIYFDKITLVDPYNMNFFIQSLLVCVTFICFFVLFFFVSNKKLGVKKKSFDIQSSDLEANIDKSCIDV